jgi:hypothetical protein
LGDVLHAVIAEPILGQLQLGYGGILRQDSLELLCDSRAQQEIWQANFPIDASQPAVFLESLELLLIEVSQV